MKHILLFLLCIISVQPATALAIEMGAKPDITISICGRSKNPLGSPVNEWGVTEIRWPEYYINPLVNYGLDNTLPEKIRSNLSLDAGYDRWNQSPTLVMDYHAPIIETPTEGLYLNPRFSYAGHKGDVAIGASIRRMWTENLFIGLNVWHDWKSPAADSSHSLRQVVAGVELSALPGRHSDLSLAANVYLPANSLEYYNSENGVVIRKKIAGGAEAAVRFKLPAMNQYFDAEAHGEFNAFRGMDTDTLGYSGGLTFSSRNGLAVVSADYGYDRNGEVGERRYSLAAELSMVFDWTAALHGSNPFSAPYPASDQRFDRDLSASVGSRASRNHEARVDEIERPIGLSAAVYGNSVEFQAGFPDLPNSEFLVQTSQSPWIDRGVIRSDQNGLCAGRIRLESGIYLLRLKNKATGRYTNPVEIQVGTGP